MEEKVVEGNMIAGNPVKLLVAFAASMIFENLFQQFYNLMDSVIVGSWVGEDALAWQLLAHRSLWSQTEPGDENLGVHCPDR